jgi:hypothetical protein
VENKPTIRPTPQLALGLIIIILGVLFTLDNLNLMSVVQYLRYWPVLLLAYGAYRLLEPGDPPHFFPGIVFTVLGGILLLNALHYRFSVFRLWPLFLVLLGLALISHSMRRDRGISTDNSSVISAFALLSGVQRACRSQSFRGGELTAILGGCEIDLRQAAMQAEEVVINTFSFWGGIEIRVPDSWAVSMELLPIMGACEDHTEAHGDGVRKHHLIVKGMAIMGGVEVRN